MVRYIFSYPDAYGTDKDMLDAGAVDTVAIAAEAAGFGGIAFTEHPVPGANWLAAGGHQALDPFVALAYAAAVTERLRLLTHLSVAPYRNPFLLAKAAASVDKLSNGRFILGIGTGYLKSEFHALGVDFDERNALFDEALDVLALHWRGEPFSYEGRHFSARNVIARPRPVQDPIPIWLGGNSKLTRRRVAERAQGWMPMMVSEQISSTARSPYIGSATTLATLIREVRSDAGARGADLDFLTSYADPGITSPGEDVARHRDALAEIAEAGATWVVVSGPHVSPAATLEFIETFAENYIE